MPLASVSSISHRHPLPSLRHSLAKPLPPTPRATDSVICAAVTGERWIHTTPAPTTSVMMPRHNATTRPGPFTASVIQRRTGSRRETTSSRHGTRASKAGRTIRSCQCGVVPQSSSGDGARESQPSWILRIAQTSTRPAFVRRVIGPGTCGSLGTRVPGRQVCRRSRITRFGRWPLPPAPAALCHTDRERGLT